MAIDFMAACRWRRRLVLAASAVLVAGGLLLPVGGSAMAQAGYRWGHQAEMLGLINDARIHPEMYPPHGNTGGANMSACSTPFMDSAALHGTARDHNTYLASQPIAWVNTFPNDTARYADAQRISVHTEEVTGSIPVSPTLKSPLRGLIDYLVPMSTVQ